MTVERRLAALETVQLVKSLVTTVNLYCDPNQRHNRNQRYCGHTRHFRLDPPCARPSWLRLHEALCRASRSWNPRGK